MNEALAVLKTFDLGGDRKALDPIDEAVRQAGHDPEKLAEIETSLLDLLDTGISHYAKEFICRRLALMGTDRAVPVLQKLLPEQETADMARYALERMPGNAASEALRDALARADGTVRVGIIDSLGQRRDRQASAALGALLNGADADLVNAAATALGCIADEQAATSLAAVKGSVPAACRVRVLDAYLRCAEALLAEGKASHALAIYTELAGEGMPTMIRYAAKRGLLQAKVKETQS